MPVLATIWWLLFWTAFGLCIGSFLNVVIHRLPRNQSITDPLWSGCPACGHRIAWYDNLPVVSFIMLKGRCRHCRQPIAATYPIVELLTALAVLALLDAFFVARTRLGLFNEPYLTWALAEDWPIFLAHVVLFACLLAMAAIDLREYWLDIRFTAIATWCGFILHTLWTPDHRTEWVRPHDATAAGSVGGLLGLAVLWAWLRTRADARDHAVSESPDSDLPEGSPTDERRQRYGPEHHLEVAAAKPAATGRAASLIGAAALGMLLVGTMVWMGVVDATGTSQRLTTWRTLLPAAAVFALILSEARVPRAADREIVRAVEAERSGARRMVLGELVMLLPAIGLGAAGVWLQLSDGLIAHRLAEALHYKVAGTWQPLYGFATAAAGFCIGGAIGWAIRIVFTLVFGKEAFGLGDIHIMAAAGCVAGWPVVLLGFIITVFVALFAWILTLPFKRTRAIPLVPWLALGYLVVVVHYQAILKVRPVQAAIDLAGMLMLNNSQTTPFGGPS